MADNPSIDQTPAADEARQASPASPSPADRKRFIEELYQSNWNDLCGWLRRNYGPGPPEPEDIAQTAFTKIASLDDYGHIQNPRAFLYTTAVNTALMGINWLARARKFIDRELEDNGEKLEEITPERIYAVRERFDVLSQALDRLSEKQREIIIRSRLHGQTYDEISEETGWSRADISRQLKAAMSKARHVLDAYDEGASVFTSVSRAKDNEQL